MVPKFEKRVKGYAADISALALTFIIVSLGVPNQTIKIIILAVVFFLTLILPIFITKGQTFGKRIQAIKIVNLDGTDASRIKVLGRELFKTILSLATFGVYSVLAYFFLTEKEVSRTIHDYVFKTKVIDLSKPTKNNRDDHFLKKSDSITKKGL